MISCLQARVSKVLFCVALSVLLHLLLGFLILLLPTQDKQQHPRPVKKARLVKVLRAAEPAKEAGKPLPPPPVDQEKEAADKPSIKTSADTPSALPDQPEYEGKRDTRAASAPDSRHLTSARQAPAMSGEEKDELVTFDQERQEGDLEHEGKNSPQAAPELPAVPPPPVPAADPPLPPAPEPAGEIPEGQESAEAHGTDAPQALTLTPDENGLLQVQQEASLSGRPDEGQHAARQGTPAGANDHSQPEHPARPRASRPFYDPSLAEWAQPQKPGFRTYERRSRSSGRFVFGRGAALNVVSTPRGAYEALVYRRVAHFWYIACDEHRGDIIPGKITISLRITRRGQIDSMALISRSGASISQQSFTFKAIRQASLPPMPPEVQADVIGPLMELIFEFNFD